MFEKVNALHLVLLTTTILFILLATSWFVTTPARLGPFGITLWFIGLFLGLSGLISLGFYALKKNSKRNGITIVTALRHGLIVSLWFSALIALNSLKQLGLKDIILITLLVVLIEFYMRRK